MTVEDAKAYTAPWTGRMLFTRRPDWEILEHILHHDSGDVPEVQGQSLANRKLTVARRL